MIANNVHHGHAGASRPLQQTPQLRHDALNVTQRRSELAQESVIMEEVILDVDRHEGGSARVNLFLETANELPRSHMNPPGDAGRVSVRQRVR